MLQNIFKREKFLFAIIFLLGLFIMALKVYYVAHDFSYIPFGFDTPRAMMQITETLDSQSLEQFTAPLGALFYFAGSLKLLTGISNINVLFIPLLTYCFLTLFIAYTLAKRAFGNSHIAIFAFLFAALFFVIPLPTHLSHFAFLSFPFFVYVILLYLRNQASFPVLFLAGESMLTSYPGLSYFLVLLFSGYFFLLLLRAVVNQDQKNIQRNADFFLLFPTIIALNYYLSNPLVIESYRSFSVYLNRIFGLWRFGGNNLFVIVPLLMLIFVFLFIYSLQFHYQKWKKFAGFILSIWDFFTSLFSFKNSILRFGAWFLLLTVLVDFFLNLFLPSHTSFYSVSKIFLSFIFGAELWDYYYTFLPAFLIAIFGAFFLWHSKEIQEKKQAILLLFIPVSVFLFSLLPPKVNPFLTFFTARGYYSVYVFLMILYGLIFYILFKHKLYGLYSSFIFYFFLFTSVIFSTTSLQFFYLITPNPFYLRDMKWLENHVVDHNIFYLVPSNYASDPDAPTKYYSYAFLNSHVPFRVMEEANRNNYIEEDFNKFLGILDEYKVSYLVAEPEFSKRTLQKLNQYFKPVYSSPVGISVYRYISL